MIEGWSGEENREEMRKLTYMLGSRLKNSNEELLLQTQTYSKNRVNTCLHVFTPTDSTSVVGWVNRKQQRVFSYISGAIKHTHRHIHTRSFAQSAQERGANKHPDTQRFTVPSAHCSPGQRLPLRI